jgi:hypothetical protein
MESEIFKLCVAAKRQRIASFVLDVSGAEFIKIARALGANLLSGPLIGAPAEEPGLVTRLSMERICPAINGPPPMFERIRHHKADPNGLF